MKHIAATDCDVEDVDRSTTHRYQEPRYFRGADAPLKLYMDNGKEDARLRPTHSDNADSWVPKEWTKKPMRRR